MIYFNTYRVSLILEEVADCPQPVASFKHRAAALYARKYSIALKILATKLGISVIVFAATTMNFVQFVTEPVISTRHIEPAKISENRNTVYDAKLVCVLHIVLIFDPL